MKTEKQTDAEEWVSMGTKIDPRLLEALEEARGEKERSLWVREAIASYLARNGVAIPDEWVKPRPRTKKFVRKIVPMHEESSRVAEEPRQFGVSKAPKPD